MGLPFANSFKNLLMRTCRNYLILALLLTACASSKHGSRPGLGGHWELSFFPTTDKTFDEVFSQRRPDLQLDAGKGLVTGSTGCNRMSGSFTVINDRFTFGSNMITTKMACPGYEEGLFLEALTRVNRYQVNATQLNLLHDSTLVMSFVRK